MKGPFSFWALFGLTFWIDVLTHLFIIRKDRRINPYNPVREVSVIIPAHKEGNYIAETINSLYLEKYPLKKVIICGDRESFETGSVAGHLMKIHDNLVYIECPYKSKAKKINYVVSMFGDELGEFVYIRDARVKGEEDCIEKMISYFNEEDVAAVTSYGRTSVPKNLLARAYHYGKAWINEIGRFRKNAQEKRNAVFVICGASTIYRTWVLKKIPIPSTSKTEDTYHTWILQKIGFRIRVADDATVSAPDVDGEKFEGIKGQLNQSYRWSCGTIQCLYREGYNLFDNRKLVYSTVIPGFIEAVMYSIPLVLLPILLFLIPEYAIGFFIGDSVFSLIGTAIIIPNKFLKTLIHYPEIVFFKYLNALVFLSALFIVTKEAILDDTERWTNEWNPPKTES